MKVSFYAFKDCKVGFTTLFPFANDDLAKNSVVNTFVNDLRNPISQVPADYELYHIGKFDDTNGEFTPEVYSVGSCLDIINAEKSKRESAKQLRKMLKESDTDE